MPALDKKEATNLQETKNQKEDKDAPKNKNTLEYWIYQDKNKKRNLHLTTYGLNDPEEVCNLIESYNNLLDYQWNW